MPKILSEEFTYSPSEIYLDYKNCNKKAAFFINNLLGFDESYKGCDERNEYLNKLGLFGLVSGVSPSFGSRSLLDKFIHWINKENRVDTEVFLINVIF